MPRNLPENRTMRQPAVKRAQLWSGVRRDEFNKADVISGDAPGLEYCAQMLRIPVASDDRETDFLGFVE